VEQNKDRTGYPITRIETITDECVDATKVGYVSGVTSAAIESHRLQIGDILLSHINSEPQIGRTVVFEGRPPLLIHGMNLLRLKVDERVVLPSMLNYILIFYRIHGAFISIASRAVGQASINQGRVESIKIAVPPMCEQQAIVQRLRLLQNAKQLREYEMKLEGERKAAMLHHLFTYGTRGETTKQTEIGEIPTSWDIISISKTLIRKQYGLSSRGYPSGQYPILRMNNLEGGKVNTSDLQFVNLDDITYRKFKLDKEDLLFNRTNSQEKVGKTALFDIEGDFVFASYLIRLAVKKDIVLPAYLNAYLNWDASQLRLKREASRGVSQSNINATKLGRFVIAVPKLNEQNTISEILRSCDAKIEALKNETKLLSELFATLLEELMKGRLSVEPLMEVAT
jgi:type I restriction enzyme S subunit